MNLRKQSGFWLSFLLVFLGGLVILVLRQDTLREEAFTVLMFVGLASSLNILMGYTGYVNFGHIVFFGLGGYFGFYLLSALELAGLPGGPGRRGPVGGNRLYHRRRGPAPQGGLFRPGHHRGQRGGPGLCQQFRTLRRFHRVVRQLFRL